MLKDVQFEGKNPIKQMENEPRELINCVAKLKCTDDIFLRPERYENPYL